MARASKAERVIQFFRTASKDEIKMVILLLRMELLIPDEFRVGVEPKPKRGRKPRLNGVDRTTSTESITQEASA